MRSDWDRYNHVVHAINSIDLSLQGLDNKVLRSLADGAHSILRLMAQHFKHKFTDGKHGFELKE